MSDNILNQVVEQLQQKRKEAEEPDKWLDGTPKLGDATADHTGLHPVDLKRGLIDTKYFGQNRNEILQERKRLQQQERAELAAVEQAERRVAWTARREKREKLEAAEEARKLAEREAFNAKKWRRE